MSSASLPSCGGLGQLTTVSPVPSAYQLNITPAIFCADWTVLQQVSVSALAVEHFGGVLQVQVKGNEDN